MSRQTFARLSAVALTAAVTTAASAQDKLSVPDEYIASCQICHGPQAKGNGPFAKMMTAKPTDLTLLAKKNNGSFPFLRVMQMIDGRTVVDAHGSREMPIWGQRYVADIGEKFGPYGGETAVRARVLELVYYIQSIQEK